MSHCLKCENQNLSFESLRGIVRPKKLSEVKSLSKMNCLSMSKSGQFVKDFSYKNFVFLFFTLTHNDRGYGHWRVAGAFAVAQRQSECGSKTCRNARQPANGHRRVLWGVFCQLLNLSFRFFHQLFGRCSSVKLFITAFNFCSFSFDAGIIPKSPIFSLLA